MHIIPNFLCRIMMHRMHSNSVGKLKLIIGSAGESLDGWIISDLPNALVSTNKIRNIIRGHIPLDITKVQDWKQYFDYGSLSCILSEHVLEHLNDQQLNTCLTNCYNFLANEGVFRIAVPDGNRPDINYIEAVKPPIDDHKQLFTVDSLLHLLEEVGFKVKPLEYYDSNGVFHRKVFSSEYGSVKRCYSLDKQENFKYADHYYTSIVVDAIK